MLIISSKYQLVRAFVSVMLSLLTLILLCDLLWKYCHGTSEIISKKLSIQLILPSEESEFKQEYNVLNKKEEIELDFIEKKLESENIDLLEPFDSKMIIEKPVITEDRRIVNKKPETKKPKEIKKIELPKSEPIEKKTIETESKIETIKKTNVEITEKSVSIQNKTKEDNGNNTVKPQLTKAQLNENSKYLTKVMKIFEKNKKYPDDARRHHYEGKIIISFKINREGKTEKVIAKTNKPKELAIAAENLVKNSKLPLPPSSWPVDASIEIPIAYKLK